MPAPSRHLKWQAIEVKKIRPRPRHFICRAHEAKYLSAPPRQIKWRGPTTKGVDWIFFSKGGILGLNFEKWGISNKNSDMDVSREIRYKILVEKHTFPEIEYEIFLIFVLFAR